MPSFNFVYVTKGQIVVKEGELNTDVYFVKSGELSG